MIDPAADGAPVRGDDRPPPRTGGTGLRACWARARVDVVLAGALGLVVAVSLLLLARLVSPAFFVYGEEFDIWFQSDLPRVFANLTDRHSNNLRATVHPLFSPIGLGLVTVVRAVTGLSAVPAVRVVMAGMAAAWVAGLFLVLRLAGLRRPDALLFGGLAAASAALIFWSIVPETYMFGAMSLLPTLILAALPEPGRISSWWFVGVSALTLSITVTNWMAGVAAAFICRPWRNAVKITVAAFAIVLVLSQLQRLVLSNVGAMLNWIYEVRYVLPQHGAGLGRVFLSFVFHTLVMPAIDVVPRDHRPGFDLFTQESAPGSATWAGTLAVVLWAVLLAIGLVALVRVRTHRRLRLMLAILLVGQLTLHILYGTEIFLYSMHWVGALVVTAALGCLTPARPLVLALAAAVLVSAGANNLLQVSVAAGSLARHGSPRQLVRYEMQRRPRDMWPRGLGHVVIGLPGSPADAKAYHEPGGSFSPAVGSFGIALWVLDARGQVRLTSDSVAPSALTQRFVWPPGTAIPAIESATAAYRARWTAERPGQWRLDVEPRIESNERLVAVVRSVGPAGGPVRQLDWDGRALVINGRWVVEVDPAPQAVEVGEEPAGTATAGVPGLHWRGEAGWGIARIELAPATRVRLMLSDREVPPGAATPGTPVPPGLRVQVPDERFAASIEAQVAHLLMGLVGAETRPGDPYHYPAPWLRDGAYVVVALARAGYLDVARRLVQDLADRDFFGGYGAEGDAPGLALWALGEVAVRVNDAAFDRHLWPSVERKAGLIETMLSSPTPVRRSPSEALVPELEGNPYVALVAAPSRDGLIVGRVELEFPRLYVNAVSYRGLLSAASMAERLGEHDAARRWRALAARQAEDWRGAFATMAAQPAWETRARELTRALRAVTDGDEPARDWRTRINALREDAKRALREPLELENERTYAFSLWPSGIVGPETGRFREALDRVWRRARDRSWELLRWPMRPAMEIAQAHQWLRLGDPERAWATVRWLLDHPASPGLYSWWDGNGEENTSHRWDYVRGWVNPPHVTPHYRASAEMLLLQLEMLASADSEDDGSPLVIGPGIPAEWTRQPMRVQGLPVGRGRVDWSWDGREMRVELSGPRRAVRLGPSFPRNALVRVEYRDRAD